MAIHAVDEDGAVVIKDDAMYAMHQLTPLEAERLIKEIRAAVNAARATFKSRKKLGEY